MMLSLALRLNSVFVFVTRMSTPTLDVGLVQSPLFGEFVGVSFNDVDAGGGFPFPVTINVDYPIRSIRVLYNDVVDGLSVIYNLSSTGTRTVDHGTLPTSTDPNLKNTEFNLSANESIIAITGKAGFHPVFGIRVNQISFVVYDKSTGHSNIHGPFGNGDHGNYGTSFRATANGIFVAFGGAAVNGNPSVAQATQAGDLGGLYGLTFTDIDYRRA